MIFSEIFKAVGYLLMTVIIVHIHNFASESDLKWKDLLSKGFLWCVGVSLVLAMLLGRPSCLEREEDGRGGTCVEYADDGFEPTNEQYISKFAFYFTLSFIPVLVAVNDRRKEISF